MTLSAEMTAGRLDLNTVFYQVVKDPRFGFGGA